MSSGLGALSGLAVGKETTEGTAVAPGSCVVIPFLNESIKPNRENVESGSIVGDSMVQAVAPGLITVEGGISLEMEGSTAGQIIAYASGLNGYSNTTVTATLGQATAAPTGVAAAGGALTAGDYIAMVATLIQRTADLQVLIMPHSTQSAAITTSGGDLTINLTWTNPSAFPDGHTHYGTAIYLTPINGLTGTEYYRKSLLTTANTTSITGSETSADTTVVPWTATIKRHTFIGTPPVTGDRLPPFTVNVLKNNDKSEQYVGCRMDSMKLSVGGGNEAMKLDCSLKGTTAVGITNFSPSFVPLEPFVGWHALAQMDGVTDCTLETFEMNLANNVNHIPGLCATPFNRGTISGKRQVTGTFTRQFQDHAFWYKLLRGQPFTLRFTSFGQPLVSQGSSLFVDNTINHGVDAVPFQYFLEIDIYRAKFNEAGGNVGGPDRIIENIAFTAEKSVSAGTEMRIRLWNSVSTYDA